MKKVNHSVYRVKKEYKEVIINSFIEKEYINQDDTKDILNNYNIIRLIKNKNNGVSKITWTEYFVGNQVKKRIHNLAGVLIFEKENSEYIYLISFGAGTHKIFEKYIDMEFPMLMAERMLTKEFDIALISNKSFHGKKDKQTTAYTKQQEILIPPGETCEVIKARRQLPCNDGRRKKYEEHSFGSSYSFELAISDIETLTEKIEEIDNILGKVPVATIARTIEMKGKEYETRLLELYQEMYEKIIAGDLNDLVLNGISFDIGNGNLIYYGTYGDYSIQSMECEINSYPLNYEIEEIASYLQTAEIDFDGFITLNVAFPTHPSRGITKLVNLIDYTSGDYWLHHGRIYVYNTNFKVVLDNSIDKISLNLFSENENSYNICNMQTRHGYKVNGERFELIKEAKYIDFLCEQLGYCQIHPSTIPFFDDVSDKIELCDMLEVREDLSVALHFVKFGPTGKMGEVIRQAKTTLNWITNIKNEETLEQLSEIIQEKLGVHVGSSFLNDSIEFVLWFVLERNIDSDFSLVDFESVAIKLALMDINNEMNLQSHSLTINVQDGAN